MARKIDGGDVQFSFSADTAEFNADLKKIGSNLDTVNKAGEGVGNDLGRNLKKSSTEAAKGLDAFTDSAGDADSVLQGLAGALDMVSPELAGVTRLVGDAAGGVEALSKGALLSGPVLGAAAAAVAALGAAYFLLQSDLAEAEAAMESAADEASKAQDVYDSFRKSIDAVRTSYQVFTGVLDEVDQAVEEATAQIQKETKAQVLSQAKRIEGTKAELALANEKIQANLTDIDAQKEATAQRDRLIERLGKERAALQGIEEVREEAILQSEFVIRSKDNEEKATKELAATEKARADANREAAKAQAELDKAKAKRDREADQAAKARLSAIDQLSKIEQAATVASLDGLDRLLEQQRIELEQLKEIQRAHENNAEVKTASREAEAALAQKHAKELADLDAKFSEESAKRDRESAEAAAAERAKVQTEMVSASVELATAVEEATAMILDNESAASGEAARRIFQINKAAALVNIAIRVAEGMATAASLPPPVDVIKAGAVAATGAMATASVVAQKPPQFHSGGMAPDERDIRVTKNEGILNSTAMGRIGGEEGLNDLNRGGGTTQTIVVQNKYTHRAFDTVVQDNLRRPGSPLRGAVKGSTKVGHKVRG